MLSALELNADGTDFKIPLWASPYANKFESLLTSLVSNKIVKQKLPGTSSVLGSEEGFKIREGDKAAGDLKNSGIVFTEGFDPVKGLQPMRIDPVTKKILPDQVIMPFKFRAESGEILNIDEFTVVVRDGEESRKMLDMTKVPKEILETFGFRIPTQKQNSMAGIEIVGFLPEAMGDLLLVPRDFTRRMGSDFDVDKLYQYFYNIFYQNGKLHNNFLSDPKAIEKAREATVAQIEELKDSLKFTKEERKLVDAYIRQNLERTEENEEDVETAQKASDLIKRSISQVDRQALDDAFTRLSILNRSYVASRQNNIIKTHLRIANSSNPDVIKMFLGTDSSGEFKELSEQVDKIRTEQGLVEPVITILSDTYQRTKYVNATAGKNAVGGFSLDSTFNATAQGKDLVIINLNTFNVPNVYGSVENPKTPTKKDFLLYNTALATFGIIESKGDISNKYTIRSQTIIDTAKQEKRDLTEEEKKSLKYKSDIIRTLQSSALDNEKEQILDKLNINDQTFDTIRALALLGFEEKDIAGLLTQEIIWEYVAGLQDANSSLTAYNPDAEEDLVDSLISKYDPQDKFRSLDIEILNKYQSQSGEELLDNTVSKTLKPLQSGETPDYNLQQLALLQKFRDLANHGKTIKQLQSTINTESKGLPKSLIEVNAKVEQISKLPTIDVFNAEKLLGEYSNNQLIKPEGINGYAAYYGTLFADKIFNEYFPYKTQGFQTAVNEILTHTPKGVSISINKKAQTQAEVFEDVKSYLYGNPNINLFSGDPTLERKRLFIDFTGNQSLATILNSVSNQTWFQKNGFLNKLSFELNKNGQISRVNFDAAAGENFDERNIYDGFVYLLTKNFPVGTFNGRDYTSRTLAQELIAAAFLEGGNQGAKQYLKYVPISYLKVLGFGEYLQKVPFDFVTTFYGNLSDYGPIYNQPSSFTRQYFQNNPDKVKTINLSDLKGTNNKTPEESFILNPEALLDNFVDVINPATGESTQMPTQFLSIYDTKESSKYALYEFDSVDRNYKRIPVLAGSYGFVAYNSTPNISVPVEKTTISATPILNATAPGYNLSSIPVEPTKGFDVNVVNNTAPVDLVAGLPISKSLSDTKEALDDVLNNLETAEGVSTLNKQLIMLFRDLQLPEGFTVKYVTNGKGQYNYNTNSLLLNLEHKDHITPNDLATTILHELTHTFTGEAIKKYERGDTDLSPSQIAAIQKLEALQILYINSLTEQGEAGSLAAFKAKYEAYAASDKTKSPDLTTAEISKYYGAIKLSEFVTMALTDVEFQKRLNDIKTEDGRTIWEQIKEALFNLLNTLGLDIKPGSALATSVKDTFDLIEANQEVLRANNITTEAFMEHGTKYKFEVNGNGEVIKASYSQGMNTVYNPMNAKNAQKKYDSLKQGIIEQPTQPTVEPVGETKESKYELFPGVYANKGQQEAIDLLTNFLDSDKTAFLLQGKGGTGKTTIIKKIVEEAKAKGLTVLGIAPTHKAKKVLGSSVKGIKTTTLAAALAIKLDETTGNFSPDEYARSRNRVPIKNADFIVIDESSMVSDKLLEEIKSMITKGTKVIFMGDRAQLPPVGQESDSKVFNISNGYELTEKMRQAATSPIINIGSKIAANVETTGQKVANPIEQSDRKNQTDPISGSSITWESNETTALNDFVEDIKESKGDLNYAKIITFNNQNHNSPQSVKNLNIKVREKLFGKDKADKNQFVVGEILTAYDNFGGERPEFYNSEDLRVKSAETRKGIKFTAKVDSQAKGSRSIEITLDMVYLDLINDEGKVIKEVPVVAKESRDLYNQTLQKLFKTDPQLAYGLQGKFANLEYGYAVTSHKAQGSTYTNVYVMEDNIMGASNGGTVKAKNQSLYVAVSRPTTKLVMVSSKNSSGPLNLSALSNLESYREMPVDTERESNRPSQDDLDTYYRSLGEDQTLETSPINPKEVEKYLLICGK
jgi:exodeoxyribonuclease-5